MFRYKCLNPISSVGLDRLTDNYEIVKENKDAEAIAAFKQIFPNKIIETINYNDVALEGGILNCTTWTYRII